MGTTVTHAPDVTGVVAARFVSPGADIDHDAGRTQPRMSLARYLGIRVLDRRDDARDTRGYDGIGAGWGFAVMRARLKRHVERGAARRFSCAPQRLDFGVGAAARLCPASAQDDAVLDNHSANGRVRPCPTTATPAKR